VYNFINAVNCLPQDGIFDWSSYQEQLTKLQVAAQFKQDETAVKRSELKD
jgi:hypothetical protein